MPPIIFFIFALVLFGLIHGFYMGNHKRIFGQFNLENKSYDRLALFIFSIVFSIFLFVSPLLFVDNFYFWINRQTWPEAEIPRWIFTVAYIVEYLAIASALGLREYKKRLKK